MRGWLIALAVAIAALTAPVVVFVMTQPDSDSTTSGAVPPAVRDFVNPLKIPPLLVPRTDAQGRKVFDLTLETGTSHFLPGTSTSTWGANGAYLGPTLRASRGEHVVINVHNSLPTLTTLHWHGMHLPAVDDGGPHQMIEPDATWSPDWTIDQPAATLWYHPHPDGQTADQVYRGVAGLFILDDKNANALALPKRYGIDDIPLVLQDKNISKDGSLNFDDGPSFTDEGQQFDHSGRLGQTILTNGTYDAHVDVHDQLIRFRLLNASDARVYNVGFPDNREFEVVASDGGLLASPAAVRRIQLAPGERAEIVASFRSGERVALHSFAPDLGRNQFGRGMNGEGQSFDLVQVRAAGSLRASSAIPARLTTLPIVDTASAVRTRHFVLQHTNHINGQAMDMDRIDFSVVAGSTEIWDVNGFIPHDFHIHGVDFRILDIGGQRPPPLLAGWKDTVLVPPFTHVRLLVTFDRYADPNHPYMYHCHILQHEDQGMMGQFVVVKAPS